MSQPIRALAVFCGSSHGANPAFATTARQFGEQLAREQITLVYGGGNVGLMGVIADATLAAGGKVVGVIPHGLAVKELAHAGLTELHIVDSMHQRKALMADRSDAFVAMPGGLGTFEEILEITTWAQLGIHRKPCGLLNVAGYYDKLIAFLDHAVEQQLFKPEHRGMILVESEPSRMLERMRSYSPTHVEKWIGRGER